MKDLVEFLKESMQLNEAKETFVKFTLFGDDASKKLVEDMATIAQKANVYYERIDDNNFKIKGKEGKNVESIIAALNSLIDGIDEEKREEYAEKIEKLQNSIEKLQNAVKQEEEKEQKEEE